MRRSVAVIALLSALGTGPGLAQGSSAQQAQSVLRSGEHIGFTRLAFLAPRGILWTIRQEGREVEVVFRGAVPTMDTGPVWDRIERDRIAAISWNDGTLLLSLACECDASVDRFASGYVVVDVTGVRDQPDGPRFATPPETTTPDTTTPDTTTPTATAAATEDEAEPAPPVEATDPAPPEPERDRVRIDGPAVNIPLILEPISGPLSDRLGRALREDRVGAQRSVPVMARGEESGRPRAVPQGAQILTRDSRATVGPPRLAPAVTADACPSEGSLRRLLTVPAAEALEDLPARVAALELDSPATVVALIDGYLMAGLGAEALHLSRIAGRDDPWRDLLAAVLDDVPGTVAPEAAWSCGPGSTLLALAAASPDKPLTAIDRQQIAAFAATLPRETRGWILAHAVRSLRRVGEDALAAELQAMVGDMPPPDLVAGAQSEAQSLAGRLAAGGAPDIAVDDALATLATLPPGEGRDDLLPATVVALAEGGALDRMTPLLDGAPPAARRAALDDLTRLWGAVPPERRSVLAAALLRWREDASQSARIAMAETLGEAGLDVVAARWRGSTSDEPRILPGADAAITAEQAAWLSRDLAASAALGDAASPRARLAALATAPDLPSAPGSIADAERRLSRTRAMRAAIDAVLAPGDAALAAGQ